MLALPRLRPARSGGFLRQRTAYSSIHRIPSKPLIVAASASKSLAVFDIVGVTTTRKSEFENLEA
jgi:hypothetical protein